MLLACTQWWLFVMNLWLTVWNNINDSTIFGVEILQQGLDAQPIIA